MDIDPDDLLNYKLKCKRTISCSSIGIIQNFTRLFSILYSEFITLTSYMLLSLFQTFRYIHCSLPPPPVLDRFITFFSSSSRLSFCVDHFGFGNFDLVKMHVRETDDFYVTVNSFFVDFCIQVNFLPTWLDKLK